MVGPRADREPALDLVPDFNCFVRDRCWDDRPIDHRRRRRSRPYWARTKSWVKFCSGIGATVLTFLAVTELDPEVFRLKRKEVVAVRSASFFVAFFEVRGGGSLSARVGGMPSWLTGVAMSTTSVAIVYAVMIEFGFNTTEYGKTILAACFVTDLGTVVAPGLIFAPFTMKNPSSSGRRCPHRRPAVAHAEILPVVGQSALRNWRRSSCCSAYLGWARSRPGPTARRCFPPI